MSIAEIIYGRDDMLTSAAANAAYTADDLLSWLTDYGEWDLDIYVRWGEPVHIDLVGYDAWAESNEKHPFGGATLLEALEQAVLKVAEHRGLTS